MHFFVANACLTQFSSIDFTKTYRLFTLIICGYLWILYPCASKFSMHRDYQIALGERGAFRDPRISKCRLAPSI